MVLLGYFLDKGLSALVNPLAKYISANVDQQNGPQGKQWFIIAIGFLIPIAIWFLLGAGALSIINYLAS